MDVVTAKGTPVTGRSHIEPRDFIPIGLYRTDDLYEVGFTRILLGLNSSLVVPLHTSRQFCRIPSDEIP